MLLQTKTVSNLCSLFQTKMNKNMAFGTARTCTDIATTREGKRKNVLHNVLHRKLSNNEVPNLDEYCLIGGSGQKTACRFMHPYSTPS